MDNSSSTSSSRRWITRAAWLTIAIVALVEIALALNTDNLRGGLETITRLRAERIQQGTFSPAVILGASESFCVDPRRVADALEVQTAENLTWPWCGLEPYGYVTRRITSAEEPPRTIVVSLPPTTMALPDAHLTVENEPLNRTRFLTLMPTTEDLKSMLQRGRYALAWRWSVFQLTPPSTQHRDALIGELLPGENAGYRKRNDERILREAQEGFFVLREGNMDDPREVLSQFEAQYGMAQVNTGPAEHWFGELLQATREAKIEVILLNPPISRVLYDRYVEKGVVEAYQSRVRSWRSRYPNLQIVTPAVRPAPNSWFSDLVHLNHQGATNYAAFYTHALSQLRKTIEPTGKAPSSEPGAPATRPSLSSGQ